MNGVELREWRRRHKVQRKTLAEILDIHASTIYRWETLERQPPAGLILDFALESVLRNVDVHTGEVKRSTLGQGDGASSARAGG